MNKTAKSRFSQTQPTEKNFFICVLFGMLWGVGVALALLVIFSVAGLFLDDPEKYAPIMALASFFISSYAAGYKSAKYKRSGGAVTGLAAGVAFVFVIVMFALATASSIKLPLFAICAPVAVLTSVFAGIAGAGKKQKAPKKHKIKDF